MRILMSLKSQVEDLKTAMKEMVSMKDMIHNRIQCLKMIYNESNSDPMSNLNDLVGKLNNLGKY
jgi:uncharacterized coiled-coil DUF342 family protein